MKDPREIRLLDPACGSMHFGLYAFDLYEVIYEEAWDLGVETLRKDYPEKPQLLRDIPKLIIENNIHGIDIDPRAVQIAGLSLWLRAQRAWQEQGVKAADRPRITRGNVVCAEPMPGSPEMLQEFTSTLKLPVLGELVKSVFEKMDLAGEAGSLLKIEEEIRNSIEDAKSAWEKIQSRPRELFSAEELNKVSDQSELTGLEKSLTSGKKLTQDFWESAEEQVLEALKKYSEQAESDGVQKRLFAKDAAKGFAFIDLCRKRYDAVVMNPPFGDATIETTELVKREYPDYAENLYVAFHGRATSVMQGGGLVGVISSRTFVTYRDFEMFRDKLLIDNKISAFADFGWEVLDGAQVETAAYVTERTSGSAKQIGPFYRLLPVPVDKKEQRLLEAIQRKLNGVTFFVQPNEVRKLPGSPLCYWSSREFIDEVSSSATLYPNWAYVGLGASPHAFYFRARWEVPPKNLDSRWKRICRGGDYSPFYRPNALTIDWLQDGRCVKEYILKKYPYLNGNYGWKIQDEDKYGMPGLTWGKETRDLTFRQCQADTSLLTRAKELFPQAK